MSDANFRRCLQALRSAQSDNERFAALMMVTRAVKEEDCDEDMKREMLDALGFRFLTRLMKTASVPEGCPSTIFKSIALSILASFAQDTQVLSNKEMKKQVSVLNEIILCNISGDDTDMEASLLSDCYDCLQGMILSPVSRQYLIQGGSVSALVEVIVSQQTGHDKARDLVVELLRWERAGVWAGRPGDAQKLLQCLVSRFKEKQDATKFEIGEVLTFVLSTVEKEEDECKSPWLQDLVLEVYSIIRSKLDSRLRDSTLCLAASLVSCQGIACLLPPVTDDLKMLLLLTHMACIEVRMVLEDGRIEQVKSKAGVVCSCYGLLENIIGHMTAGISLGLEKKQVLQLHSAMLGAFNSVIFFLSQVSQQEIEMSRTSLLVTASVRVLGAWLAEETSALREEIYNLLPFLVQICKAQVQGIQGEYEETPETIPSLDSLTLGAQPHLETQPTVTQEEEVTSKNTDGDQAASSEGQGQKSVRFDPATTEGEGHPVLSADSPQFSGMDQCKDQCTDQCKDQCKDQCMDQSVDQCVDQCCTSEQCSSIEQCCGVDLVRFLLPGFCHLTAEDKSRTILLGESIHVFLLEYFRQQMLYFLDNRDDLDTKDCIASLCGIFLNLSVTEPDTASSHHTFHRLLDMVCHYLTKTVHDFNLLVMSGNFVTIGLMLLRHQKHRTDIQPEGRDQFLAGSISFLSKCHCRVSQKPPALGVSETYRAVWEDISELWFLSIQGLCALVPLYPDVAKLLLKSGWLPALIRMLLGVKGEGVDPDTETAFLSLILTLASRDKPARLVIREKRGIELAHMYHCEDLEKALTDA
ncbi:neurochondrin-like [Haliotis rufescens]|uniref:neurochondrin-like n=1 Tax=Haliotis rufescens TaxID=6454 RepID=UPI00201F4D58|nr:neurochondrin-like [Haliotis rufescens]